MMKRLIVVLVLLMIALSSFAGWEQEVEAQDKPEVAVLIPGTVEFFAVQKRGINKAAEDYGLNLIYADAEWDAGKQLAQVENFITKKVDLILLCSADNIALQAVVPLANKAGIPLISFSNTVGSDAHGKYEGVIAYIGRDEIRGGEMLGEMAEKLLGDKDANIVLIQGSPGTSAQRFREKGFLNIVKKHSNWKIVADRPITGWTKEGSLSAVEDFLQTGQRVDIVVTQWWSAGIAAAMALKEKGLTDVHVVSLEYTKEIIPYVKAGEIDITTYFSIVEEGYKAAEAAAKYLKGEKVPEFVEIVPVWVTTDNVDQFEPEM